MAFKRTLNFVKTTAVGGLLVIVPVAVVLFVLGQLLFALYSAGLAIVGSGFVPNIVSENPWLVLLIALGSLLGLCFGTGLAVQTRLGGALRGWFGRNVARRIPMYKAITSLTERFAGLDGEEFVPVEVDLYHSDARAIGFLVEKLPDQRCAVFLPSAPVATVGNVVIVPEQRIQRLDASVSETLGAVTQWGVDAKLLYRNGGTDIKKPGAP
ncbi:MAG: DUF502 domain-containing protein [Pseudomonadota bacterium]